VSSLPRRAGGIRPFFRVAAGLVCGFAIFVLIQRRTAPTSSDKAAEQSAAKTLVSTEVVQAWRRSHRWDSVPSPESSRRIDPVEAGHQARDAANKKARDEYGIEPFRKEIPARVEHDEWVWEDRAGNGLATFEARIVFAGDGAVKDADIAVNVLQTW
jgi:hypothetical protein